ncbi:MAG TPA: hypothetical protein VGW38_27970 [Chloroflexota bacterium]|nr:hypothetical protein [Chloroflexota bacterium]
MRKTGAVSALFAGCCRWFCAAVLLVACSGRPPFGVGPEAQGAPQCPKISAALADVRFAHQWSDFPWRDYGFADVAIPADIGGLRVRGVSCTEDGLAGEVTSVFTDLYNPARDGDDVAALLLVGEEDPTSPETWKEYLESTFPGDWEFERTGSVLVGRPAERP